MAKSRRSCGGNKARRAEYAVLLLLEEDDDEDAFRKQLSMEDDRFKRTRSGKLSGCSSGCMVERQIRLNILEYFGWSVVTDH